VYVPFAAVRGLSASPVGALSAWKSCLREEVYTKFWVGEEEIPASSGVRPGRTVGRRSPPAFDTLWKWKRKC